MSYEDVTFVLREVGCDKREFHGGACCNIIGSRVLA